MIRLFPTVARAALWLLLAASAVFASELVLAETKSDLVPRPVPYAVLLPDGYQASAKPLPLLLVLHGGGLSRDEMIRTRSTYDELWQAGRLPKMIVAAPSTAPRGFYMDFKDGAEKWESFLMGPFRELMEKTYHASTNPKEHFLTGFSMGGLGTLRMGFKHPEMFGGVAALEAAIEPILHWRDMRPRNRFWKEDSLFESVFGKPVDPVYWEANHPASIARANPARLRSSGLAIYMDVGDHDLFFFYEGNEFLHRILFDNAIEHEYHLVHGADHVGETLRPRLSEALLFVARVLNPRPPDPQVISARKMFVQMKAKAGTPDPLDPKE
jgi:S-formylglutathione hydrolase